MRSHRMEMLARGLAAMCTPVAKQVKRGQAVDVKRGKKKFKLIVTEPNASGSCWIKGKANGKTFSCSFVGGEWIVQE